MNYKAPADCPIYLITRASMPLTAVLKKELAESGYPEIKPAYLGAMMCLWADEGMDEVLGKLGSEDGMKLTELGRCAGLEPSTMTGLVDRMERDGLACRAHDPKDRRALKVSLTEKGVQSQGAVFGAVERMLQKAFAGIEAEEMDIAKQVLRKILINAGKGSVAP